MAETFDWTPVEQAKQNDNYQHRLPQFLLRKFGHFPDQHQVSQRVFFYNKLTRIDHWEWISKTSGGKRIYTFVNEDFDLIAKNYSIDPVFTLLENKTAPIIDTILRTKSIKGVIDNKHHRAILDEFFISLFLRSVGNEKPMKDKSAFEKLKKDFLRYLPIEDWYLPPADHQTYVGTILTGLLKNGRHYFSEFFDNREIFLVKGCSRTPFVLGDNPLVVRGMMSPLQDMFLPINSELGILYPNRNFKLGIEKHITELSKKSKNSDQIQKLKLQLSHQIPAKLPPNFIRVFNWEQVNHASEIIYSKKPMRKFISEQLIMKGVIDPEVSPPQLPPAFTRPMNFKVYR